MELNKAIMNRRSIRKFTDYYVTDDEIKEILNAARYAPSWANTQTWKFIVLRDRDLIREVTETYSETNIARGCSFSASALIVACAKRDVAGYRDGKMRTKFSDWFMFDLGLAVQNLCLRAHDLGLGTVIVGSMDHDRCSEIVKLPEGYEVITAIPVGKPAPQASKKAVRKEISEFVFLDKFGASFE